MVEVTFTSLSLEEPSFETENFCKVCGVVCNSYCKSCTQAYYCSKEHQKSDWKTHKKQCFPIKVIKDQNRRMLIATRNLKKGQLILSEYPILITPNTRDENGLTCLGCCSKLNSDKTVSCNKCGWELCSLNCETVHFHTKNECPIFQENNILPSTKTSNSYQKYCEIGVLRILLTKDREPRIWSQLIKLDHFSDARKTIPDTIFNIEKLISFIREDCRLLQFSEELIDVAFGILRGNAFDSSDYTNFIRSLTPDIKYASLLFPTALIPGTNCIPNGHYIMNGRVNGNYKISFFAAVDIAANEKLSVAYDDTISGTFVRQQVKQKVFFYNCKCDCCIDPTEMGTFISSPKCLKCKKGYYIQTNPLVKESKWRCKDCGSTEEYCQVINSLQTIRKKLYSCINNSSLDSSIKALHEIKLDNLHPNHFFILQTEMEICSRIIAMIGTTEMTDNKSNVMNFLCTLVEFSRHLLSVIDILRPGYNRIRGYILYYLQFGLLISLTSISEVKGIDGCPCPLNGKEGIARYKKLKIKELTFAQTEAEKIFELQPDDCPEATSMLSILREELKPAAAALKQ